MIIGKNDSQAVQRLQKLYDREKVAKVIFSELNNFTALKPTLMAIIKNLKKFTGIEAISIRLHDEGDYPYFVYAGFSQEFIIKENSLCAKDENNRIIRNGNGDEYLLECMCGNIIRGRTDSEQPFFTDQGSFWSNDTSKLLESSTEEDRQSHTRNYCNYFGYESVALIPIKTPQKTLGLIQLNDKRVGQFTEDLIIFIEQIGKELGLAVQNSITFTKLKLEEKRLHALFKLSQLEDISEKELSDYALEECVKLTQSEVGYFHFFDSNENTIQLVNWSKKTLEICTAEKNLHYPLESAGIWADCVRIKKPVIHNDYQNLETKKGYPKGHFPLKRHMSTPVFDGDKIVAIAGIGNKKNPYNESDTRQLVLFMNNLWRIIKQRRSEEEIKKSNELLLNKSEEMEDFVNTLSHDLKSPLTSILGFISLINAEFSEDLPENLGHYLERVEKNVIHMRDIITDILEYSRINKIKEEKQVCSLNEILDDAANTFQPRLLSLEISINIQDNFPEVFVVKKRFIQVFENLLDNAIKYMGNGKKSKQISIGFEFEETKRKFVTVYIQDTGIGIPSDYFPKLFQLFFRIPSILSEKVSGSGIGLANVKKIVETHGGTIWLESEVGIGSTFYLDIPLPSE